MKAAIKSVLSTTAPDFLGGHTTIVITMETRDGSPLELRDGKVGGWLVRECVEIAQRPAEFVE